MSPAWLPLKCPWARADDDGAAVLQPCGAQRARGQQAGWVCPQRSLEDEINRTTAEDLPIFAVSYLVIFLYMSLALGSYASWRRLPVSRGRDAVRASRTFPIRAPGSKGDKPQWRPGTLGSVHSAPRQTPPVRRKANTYSALRGTASSSAHAWGQEVDPVPLQVDAKATLGLGGVVVVLGAVTAAMGLFSYLGVPSSLVVLQVVPFLVLAVGADNIFILVLEYQVRARPRLRPRALSARLPILGCRALRLSFT